MSSKDATNSNKAIKDKLKLKAESKGNLTEKKGSGGRPKVKESIKKNKQITLYFTDDEYDKLQELATESGLEKVSIYFMMQCRLNKIIPK
jgi:hypothetical protein